MDWTSRDCRATSAGAEFHAPELPEVTMSMQFRTWLLFGVCAAAAAPALAGPVEVSFVNADRYFDAGDKFRDEARNLRILEEHLKALGQSHLPSGQALKIEVLQVDLAGEMRPTRRGTDMRIARGGADWPRITLRYTLQGEGGAVAQPREETVSDMTYQMRSAFGFSQEALHYEKRMLTEWFRERFASAP
jgi:hypothetical protein